MASAFAQGFQTGGAMFDSAERNRLLQEQLAMDKAREARAAEEHGLRMSGLRRVEDATTNLDRITNVGIQNPEAIKANDADFDMAVEATGRGLAMPAAAPQQPEWRKATGLELNDAQARLAAAKGDIAGMEALRLGRKGIEFDEGYKKHLDDWTKMDDAARLALIDKLSYDTNIPGNGTWVAGKGKQAGYMVWTPPGKDPVKLSGKEAQEMYILGNLMQIDPTRARGEMDKVSDRVRALAKDTFDVQSKGVAANNAATHYAAQDANDAARTAAQGQYYGVLRDRANRPQAGDLREFVNDKGEVTLVDITGLKRNADGTIPLPAGMKPRTAKPSVTPEAYAKTLKDMTDVYGDPAKARMATDQLYGLTAPTTQVADSLRALNDKKGGGARPAPAAAAPAAPLGLTQRLGNAISSDNTAGNHNQFLALAAEAERNAPAYVQQISVLRDALGHTRSDGERANIENRIGELERDLMLYSSILEQRGAQRGY